MTDLGTKLLSGTAHDLGGILFALRVRIDAIGAAAPSLGEDLRALEATTQEIQRIVDCLRVLTARVGTGTLVRQRGIDSTAWWERTAKLARYLLPRSVSLTGTAAEGIDLRSIDVGCLTMIALSLLARAGSLPEARLRSRLEPAADRLWFTVDAEANGGADTRLDLRHPRVLARQLDGRISSRSRGAIISLRLDVPLTAARP